MIADAMDVGIKKLYDALLIRDLSVCGEAPAWILETIVEQLIDFIELGDDSKDGMRSWALGAIRFVADQCPTECGVLLASLQMLT
jgi:hypothetical protein